MIAFGLIDFETIIVSCCCIGFLYNGYKGIDALTRHVFVSGGRDHHKRSRRHAGGYDARMIKMTQEVRDVVISTVSFVVTMVNDAGQAAKATADSYACRDPGCTRHRIPGCVAAKRHACQANAAFVNAIYRAKNTSGSERFFDENAHLASSIRSQELALGCPFFNAMAPSFCAFDRDGKCGEPSSRKFTSPADQWTIGRLMELWMSDSFCRTGRTGNAYDSRSQFSSMSKRFQEDGGNGFAQ